MKESNPLLLLFYCLFLIQSSYGGGTSDWLSFALQTQRNLELDETIDIAAFIGAHNSYNSEAEGYDWPNQVLSITDQLSLGVRWLELDLHYIPELSTTDAGPYRICHGSTDIQELCDNVAGWATCEGYGLENYGEDTGCKANSKNFTQFFQEIATWMKANPSEVIVVNFDVQISDSDFGVNPAINKTIYSWLNTYFGAHILTAKQVGGGAWPATRGLAKNGLTILFNSNSARLNGNLILPDFRGFVWPASKINTFSGFPSCTSTAGESTPQFLFFQEDRCVITVPDYGMIYDGPDTVGLFTNDTAHEVLACGFSQFFDLITADLLTAFAVWSWDINQPIVTQTRQCGSINRKTGRWQSESCDASHYFACANNSTGSWAISTQSAHRDGSLKPSCPTGFSFATPINAAHNQQLVWVIATIPQIQDNVWISMNNFDSKGWTPIPEETHGPNIVRAPN